MIRAFLPVIMQILLLVVLGNTVDSTIKYKRGGVKCQ